MMLLHTIVLLFRLFKSVFTLDNGLSLTPPMGWLSWNYLVCNVLDDQCEDKPETCLNAKNILKVADDLVKYGFKDVGYDHVIIDDCWLEKKRDENGRMIPNKKRFPDGMKTVADYVHNKGLKFGMYTDYGTKTCQGFPGLLDPDGDMKGDAEQFAGWEIDYLKVDGCYSDTDDFIKGYPKFGQMLNDTGRKIEYSCSWPAYVPNPNYSAIAENCNLWRVTGDIFPQWDTVSTLIAWIGNNQDKFMNFGGPGHWNDFDMVTIGNVGDTLTTDQKRSHMAIWALISTPLFLSNNLAKIDDGDRKILLNKDVIAINQDPLGIQGTLYERKDNYEIWMKKIKPKKDGKTGFVVVILNNDEKKELKLDKKLTKFNIPKGKFILKDLFDSNNLPSDSTDKISITIPKNGSCLMFTAIPA